jgi:hypothetical protein
VQARRDEDAVRPTLEQPSQIGLAQGQGQTAQIFTVERQDVEGVQLHSSSCRRECSALKSGMPSTPSTTASPSMTMPDTVLQRGFDDPRIAVGPVVAASGDEAHAVAVTLQAEPVTVVFHFMEPVGTVRNVGRLGRKTKLKHSLKVGAVTANCESGAGCGRPPPGVGHVRRGRQVDGASSWNNTLASLRPCGVTLARRGLLECDENVMAATLETSVYRSRSGCAYLFSTEGENGCQMKLAAMALAITVALSNTAAPARPGAQMPTFNINRNCSSEAAAGVDIQATMAGCVRDEVNAKKQLDQEWSKWGSNLKRECVEESAMGGDQSYVELITCLEMSSSQWKGTKP